ncbi:C1 family peptidase [Labilibaculum sp.]|uniref:C1 family peptidase n=1 Tax=Labilibaculum sp. TaxID=2060723 RepID=UPI003562AE5D
MKRILFFGVAFVLSYSAAGQEQQDNSTFVESKSGVFKKLMTEDFRKADEQLESKEVSKRFVMDQSSYELPNKVSLFKNNIEWAQPPISQGKTGTCWCFSTTSFYESEVYRLSKKEVKISEIYTAYWEYVEKARRFIQERGDSNFDRGSEANAVTRIMKQYGACPNSEYTGLLNGRKFHNHAKMYEEMKVFLNDLKQRNAWNEEVALSNIKLILNHYLGTPPTKFTVEGKEYTPKAYLVDYLKLDMDDYVEILSYKQEPFWQQVEYKVPDNWWHSKEYYNVPLDDYMNAIKKAIRAGYTMSIGGDTHEAGFITSTGCAMVPSFDIPSEYINDDARQFRFSNGSTTDDHGMHLIGYYVDKEGKDWYLIKDSSGGSRKVEESSAEFGYYFFREDYMKLKMMDFTVHKDAVKDLLKKFK